MTLEAAFTVGLGSLQLSLDLTVAPGEVVALLGPNGAGKSTALRCIAGLLPIDTGTITVDGQCLDDPVADVFVPAERRHVGVVFQDYVLFASLNALENVAFGLRARGMAKAEARTAAGAWLERVGLGAHANAKPGELSGGQAQRVALARALATNPRVLLLDEPLAALDAGTRGELRRDLRRHLASFEGMRVLVTHDPIDAFALADRVVVLEAGAVVQTGTLLDVTAHPRSKYVADLVGINLVSGTVANHVLTTAAGGVIVTAGDSADGPAFAAIRPQAIALHKQLPEGSPRNVWVSTVADIDHLGDRVRLRLGGVVPLVAEITPAALAALELRPGDAVWAVAKATEVATYPA